MKALSLMQPWATLVAIGAKKIETRSWATKYRGPLAIAASKKRDKDLPYWCYARHFQEALREGYATPHGISLAEVPDALPVGSILCVCRLVDCVPITSWNAPPEPERSFGDYSTEPKQRYAWHLAEVRMLTEPIPAKGKLGLWTPAPELLAEIMRRVA